MTQAFTRSLSATAAISAVLALGSTPVFAQDAAPAIQLPPPAATSSAAPVTSTSPTTTVAPSVAAPVAAPAIVLPEVSAAPSEPTASAPKSVSAPVEPRAERTAPERTVQRSATRAVAAPASAQAPSRASAATAAPSQAEAAPASSHNILAADPVPPAGNTARPAATPAPAQDRGDGLPGEAIAGLLAALGLGAIGYGVMRSRRRRDEDEVAYDTAIEPVAAEPPAFAPEARSDVAEPAPRTAPVFGAPGIAGDRQVQYGFARSSAQAPADGELLEREPKVLATPIAPAAAPAAAPNRKAPAPLAGTIGDMSAEERTRLIDEMVEAEPDEANPFIARPARRKRARLILQRMEHEQRQNSNAPFDWRTYRPTTEPTEPASPPLVTA